MFMMVAFIQPAVILVMSRLITKYEAHTYLYWVMDMFLPVLMKPEIIMPSSGGDGTRVDSKMLSGMCFIFVLHCHFWCIF